MSPDIEGVVEIGAGAGANLIVSIAQCGFKAALGVEYQDSNAALDGFDACRAYILATCRANLEQTQPVCEILNNLEHRCRLMVDCCVSSVAAKTAIESFEKRYVSLLWSWWESFEDNDKDHTLALSRAAKVAAFVGIRAMYLGKPKDIIETMARLRLVRTINVYGCGGRAKRDCNMFLLVNGM
jgi:hypothetical protein